MWKFWNKPKVVGLALGSGSARGWAHIGVIKALLERGIEINCVAGCSIGSLVGAAFCHGKLDQLEEFARKLDWLRILSFMDITFHRSGLIDGERFVKFLHEQLKVTTIEQLKLPYCAIATELKTGSERVLNSGDLINAIRASVSIPGILTPARYNGELLVDGGLVNPVPVCAARNLGANLVIAVDLNHGMVENVLVDPDTGKETNEKENQIESENSGFVDDILGKLDEFSNSAFSHFQQLFWRDPSPNIFEVMVSSINIMEEQITAANLKIHPPDILIQPNLGHIGILDYHRASEVIEVGYKAAIQALDKSKRKLK